MKLHLTYEFDSEEEMRAHLGETVERTPEPATAPAAAPAAATPEPTTNDSDEPTRDDVDADGMPYDETIHSSPPAFTAKGLWRSARGKSDEAAAARAEFKAKGGNVPAPETPPAASGMPGAMPGANALPTDAPAPISLDRLLEKINEMISRGEVDEPTLTELYSKHANVPVEESFGVFQTNETARANLFAELDTIGG